ncbi:MAG TPA: hypothetical protein VMZ91_10970 [Candidatus Paceibacterota bacterium]|nr:hypothetical protein [Candidatus Paceibacterota bacterium]
MEKIKNINKQLEKLGAGSKKGKECKYCHHAIYYSRPLQSWRCGPGCDRAEPVTSIFDK